MSSSQVDKERFSQQRAFILELDQEKLIQRRTHLLNLVRRENDAEHAWHMAVMLYVLREYANDDFDLSRAMLMALIHDVVEIDVGDTYAYDVEGRRLAHGRERRAAQRIFSLLPDDQAQELYGLWEEFEANETPEARMVHLVDNMQPMLLNLANKGDDWKTHQVSYGQTSERRAQIHKASQSLGKLVEELFADAIDKGYLLKDDNKVNE